MSDVINFTTTTVRAYTMSLEDPSDDLTLWITHRKVNLGTQVFGDFLLTLRGGLGIPPEKPTPETRRLLVLCWFSVESRLPETAKYIVRSHHTKEGKFAVKSAMEKSLRDCLKEKRVKTEEVELWVRDCMDTLTARIRDDSEWIQRWMMFRDLQDDEKPDPTEIQQIMEKILGKDFLSTKSSKKDKKVEKDNAGKSMDKPSEEDERKAGNARNQGRQFVCNWFGTGKKMDFRSLTKAYEELVDFAIKMKRSPPQNREELRGKVEEFRNEKKWQAVKKKFKGRGNGKILRAVSDLELATKRKNLAMGSWEEMLLAIYLPNGSPLEKFLKPEFWEKIESYAAKQVKALQNKDGSSSKKTPWHRFLNKIEKAVGIKYGESRGKANTEFFYLMMGQAAGLLSKTHSWVRRAESEREQAKNNKLDKDKKFSPQFLPVLRRRSFHLNREVHQFLVSFS